MTRAQSVAEARVAALVRARLALRVAEAELADWISDTGEAAEHAGLGLRFDLDNAGELAESHLYPRSPAWTWPPPSSAASRCSATPGAS